MDLNGPRIGASSAVTPRTDPIRLARKLERGPRVQRFFAARSQAGGLIVSLTMLIRIVALVAWRFLRADTAMLIATLHAHLVRVAVGAISTAAGVAVVERRHHLAERDFAACWLATPSIDPCDVLTVRRWWPTP